MLKRGIRKLYYGKLFQWQNKIACKFDYEMSTIANKTTKFQEQ